jgi:hypothetical protein
MFLLLNFELCFLRYLCVLFESALAPQANIQNVLLSVFCVLSGEQFFALKFYEFIAVEFFSIFIQK